MTGKKPFETGLTRIEEEKVQAIRQIKAVKGRTVVVHLPDEFPATDQVEIIILSVPTQAEGSLLDASEQFLAVDTSQFTEDQRQAYAQASLLVQKGRRPDEPRLLGLFAGLVQIADDFDTPVPDEELFWGKSTDEYGVSLEQ